MISSMSNWDPRMSFLLFILQGLGVSFQHANVPSMFPLISPNDLPFFLEGCPEFFTEQYGHSV
jgi:hypothetical protein